MLVSRGVAGLAHLGGCSDDEYRVYVRRREEHMNREGKHQQKVEPGAGGGTRQAAAEILIHR